MTPTATERIQGSMLVQAPTDLASRHARGSPMKTRLLLLAAALPAALLAAEPPRSPTPAPVTDQMAETPTQSASTHVMHDAAQLKWGDAPPVFEKGAQAVVLSGDPGKPGWFVLRLKAPAGFKVALHWHPTDEQVTVLEGDFSLRMGDGASEHSHTFAPGGYVVLPAHMQHAASTQGGAVVQVEGMGPFELIYVDPKDDPRKRTPAAADAGH
jgi:quercetin dioxygenase-like cupin family protein